MPVAQARGDDTTSGSGQVQPSRISSPAPVITRTLATDASWPAPIRTRTAATAVAQLPEQQRARGRLGGVSRLSWQRLCQRLGFASGRNLQVRYPRRFKCFLAVIMVMGASWLGNYAFVVLPAVESLDSQPCKHGPGTANDEQLAYNARMLFVYFIWFAVARTSLFIPCIASRFANVQARTHGFCRTYCVHLIIRDGPLYIFVIGSILFWFHLMQAPECDDGILPAYRIFRFFAIYSCLVSVLCMFFVYWHNKLLVDASRPMRPSEDRGAPPGTLEKMQTRAYDEAVFGDEEGKLYPAECAICLGTWEEDDVIKVTPCGHAFHEECLRGWFRNAKTCALCRRDCTNSQPRSPMPRAVGAPADHVAGVISPPGSPTTSSDNTLGSLAVVAEVATVDEESDDLEAAADEGPMPQILPAVRQHQAENLGPRSRQQPAQDEDREEGLNV